MSPHRNREAFRKGIDIARRPLFKRLHEGPPENWAPARSGLWYWPRAQKALFLNELLCCLPKHKIAAVPHGFRSSFRDWVAEETEHPRKAIEATLAHVVWNKVEAAMPTRTYLSAGVS